MAKRKLEPEQCKPFFDKMLAEKGNKTCVDCNENNPQWASVSFGTFFCLRCSGVHRSLGSHLTFVRSLTMDKWSDDELSSMMAGGNDAFRAYLRSYGVDPIATPMQKKYTSALAEAYRQKIKAAIQGKPWSAPPKSAANDLLGAAAAPPAAAKKDDVNNDDAAGWDDWGDDAKKAPRARAAAAVVEDDEPPAAYKKTPAQYSSAAEAARLSRFEGSRGISSDSYFDGDDNGKPRASGGGGGGGAGGDEFFSSLTDGLSRLTSTVADTVTTTAKKVGAKIDEAKPADLLAGAGKSVTEGAAIGWSAVSSYWDKAKESVLTLTKDVGATTDPAAARPATAAAAPAAPAAAPVKPAATSAPPRKSSAAPAATAAAVAPARKLAATEPSESTDIDDDFAAQLRAAQAEADALSAKRAARQQNVEQQKAAPKPAPTRSRLAATEDDGDFFQGFGDGGGDNDDDAEPAKDDDGGENWDW